MPENLLRIPLLNRIYRRFLDSEDSAGFIAAVSDHYTVGTLQRLYTHGHKSTRRAAILAIGFLGDFDLNETMGRALCDSDRAVRLLSEHNIRQIWLRQGTPGERQQLILLESLNSTADSSSAVDMATQLIDANSLLGEAWNQRAIAHSMLGNHHRSVQDCHETLMCNRFHFPAAVGMGQGFLQLDDVFKALDSFRLALSINPDLECLRGQIIRLERMLEEN